MGCLATLTLHDGRRVLLAPATRRKRSSCVYERAGWRNSVELFLSFRELALRPDARVSIRLKGAGILVIRLGLLRFEGIRFSFQDIPESVA